VKKIFISIYITDSEVQSVFEKYTQKQFFKSLNIITKDNKILLYISTYKNYNIKKSNLIKLKNKNIKVQFDKMISDINFYKNIIRSYNSGNYEIYIPVNGNFVLSENYFSDLIKILDKGYSSAFGNVINVSFENYTKFFTNKNQNNFNNEKFLYKELKNNQKSILLNNNIDIKNNKKYYKIIKNIPNLLAFSGPINEKCEIFYGINKNNHNIFLNKDFSNFFSLDLNYDFNSKITTRYPVTRKIIDEIIKFKFKKLLNFKQFENYALIIKKKSDYKKKINLKKLEIKNNSRMNLKYYFEKQIIDDYDNYIILLKIVSFINYCEVNNAKFHKYFIILISFLPFFLKWKIYTKFLKKIFKNELNKYVMSEFLKLPRKPVIKFLFDKYS